MKKVPVEEYMGGGVLLSMFLEECVVNDDVVDEVVDNGCCDVGLLLTELASKVV